MFRNNFINNQFTVNCGQDATYAHWKRYIKKILIMKKIVRVCWEHP